MNDLCLYHWTGTGVDPVTSKVTLTFDQCVCFSFRYTGMFNSICLACLCCIVCFTFEHSCSFSKMNVESR